MTPKPPTTDPIDIFLSDLALISNTQLETTLAIRKLFLIANPTLTEKIKYGGLTFHLPPNNNASKNKNETKNQIKRENETLCGGIFPYKTHITIEFTNGATFTDPHHLLLGNGKYRRHLKIHTPADIQKTHLKSFIHQAVNAN